MRIPWRSAGALTRGQGYALSLAALVAAVLLRSLVDPFMGDTLPLVTLFGAVAAAVWVSGYAAAGAVAVLGYLACAYLFIEPRGTIVLADVGVVVGIVAYVFTCTLIIGFGEMMRAAQNRAAERQETLRVTLRSIGDAVITTDVEGRVTYLNEVAESLTGWSHEDAYGEPLVTVFRIISDGTRRPVDNPAERALREGVVVGLANHTLLIRKDGTERAIDDSAAPIRNERGQVSGCVLIFRDVAAQRRSERDTAVQLLGARLLASIVESSEIAIISKSLDGVIQTWNAAAERLFGHPAEKAVGRHISLVIPPERIAEEEAIVASLKAGKRIEHFETERLRADGRRVWVSLTISPVRDDDGNVIGASKMARDITRERLSEAEREKFVTLVETSTDFIGICDLQGVPSFVNRVGLSMVGLDNLEQARCMPVGDFFFPEDRPKMIEDFFPKVLEQGHGEVEVRFRNFKTGEARWMAYKLLTLKDRDGRPTAFATVSQDVTERRRLEDNLRGLAADLSEADRRKDEFLATLAHELRGPLAPLSNVLEIWKRSDDDGAVRRARDTMERQLGQMIRLVDDLLDLNRITHNRLELRPSRIELATAIQQAAEASRPLAESLRHELRLDLPAEPIWLQADPARLTQVFGNLLNNACKYSDTGGSITVTALREGSDVVVAVQDTGTGIPRDKLESIFEMFTQVEGKADKAQGGLGIGLTLVKRLVHMHGGKVEAYSGGLGAGSRFVVRLPVPPEEADAKSSIAAAERPKPQARRILVVDDNTDSAVSLAMLLRIEGNETFTAHDGVEAVAEAEKHRPDVVLLDIGLPKMSGHEVCRHIRRQAWGKNIVLVALTGWGQNEDRRKSREAGFDGHLVKPVDFEKLSALLSSLGVERRAG